MRAGGLAAALRIVVVTDAGLAAPRPVTEVVGQALRAGARCIQLREKGTPARDRFLLGRAMRDLTRRFDALLIVNDRLDVALAVEADGVHVGPDDLPVAALRAHVPAGFVIGASADTVGAARRAVDEGADYIGCGAVFGTRTKDVGDEAIGRGRLDEVARAVPVPVVAIGGVGPANASLLASTAAAGAAVVSAVMGAHDPGAAVRGLLEALDG